MTGVSAASDQRTRLQWLIERYGYARREGGWGGHPSAEWLRLALHAADVLVIDELQAQIDASAYGDTVHPDQIRRRIAELTNGA